MTWARIAVGLAQGRLAPYLGPGCLEAVGETSLPRSSRELANRLNARIAVPGRVRGNLWSTAQWIEGNKHRVTLIRALQELFSERPSPAALHHWLAGLDLPLIVDEWYDTLMAEALAAAGKDFAEIQGIRRSGQRREEPWVKIYDGAGALIDGDAGFSTILYKPHGAVRPAANFLISDSDYVEVLTEIDIQTPIPEAVIARRANLGFVFLGCRFVDQMQRVFAKQIIKRSAGPHVAVIEGELTKNEQRFLALEGIERIDAPLAEAVAGVIAAGSSR